MISIKDNFPAGIKFGDNKCTCGHNKFIMLDNGKVEMEYTVENVVNG